MKTVSFGMTKEELDREDIEVLFGTPQERKKASRKEYYLAHREKELAACRAWREANKERYIARNRAYREKNKERLNKQSKEYRKARKGLPKNASSSSVDVRSCGSNEGAANT